MGPSDDAAAQRELTATLERFRGDARAALGLRPNDDAAAARKAFMALCKVYHPAKFARFAPQTKKLSNEVFLAIRRAYENVFTLAPAHAAPAAPPPAATTTSRIPTMSAPPPAAERQSQPIPRIVKFTPPTGIPIQTPPPHAPPPRAATPRPATPSPAPHPPPPPQQPPSPPPRAATPTPGRESVNPQLDRALELANAQKWPEARAAFVELATRHPGDPRYRSYVHYARGWEAFSLGKDSEARAEWQRALAFDPRNDLVKWALESTGVGK